MARVFKSRKQAQQAIRNKQHCEIAVKKQRNQTVYYIRPRYD